MIENKEKEGKLQEIFQGWKNLVFKNPQVEKLAKARLDICLECPHRTNYPDKMSVLTSCKLCGCIIEAKVRNEKSTCPKDKW